MTQKSLSEIIERLGDGAIIAIDGPAGAGKTTLANRIARNFSGTSLQVHMDDLYDGWANALSPKLTRTLVQQILVPVSARKNFGYRKYDWINGKFGPPSTFSAPELLIVEGVGSGQRAAGQYLDELIWIDIESEIGLNRVLSRDGEYLKEEMMIWQMREQEHFAKENTRDRATIRLDGTIFI